MTRRRRTSGDEITLFPFLAVLICTVGSLIVLLVVVVQQAKASAVDISKQRDEQRQRVQQAVSDVKNSIEDLQWRMELLAASRVQTAADLERRRQELSYIEDEIRQLRSAIERAAAEDLEIEAQAAGEVNTSESAERKLQQLREDLDYARESLAQARREFQEREPSYALVPYVGPNGTRRRPIFIECREDRVVFQPEGIELFGDDFREPLTDDNALAAALRAVREYLSDAAAGDREPPYPLIVVRPNGAQSYAATRAAMQSWETEFGYELLDDSIQLSYPPVDSALVDVVRQAVEEARVRRQLLQQIAPARFGRPQAPLLTASRSGGFVAQGGSSSGGGRSAAAGPDRGSEGAAPFGPTHAPGGPGSGPGSGRGMGFGPGEPDAQGFGLADGQVADEQPTGGLDGNPYGGRGARGRGSAENGTGENGTGENGTGENGTGENGLGGRPGLAGSPGERFQQANREGGAPSGSAGNSDESPVDGSTSGRAAGSGDRAAGQRDSNRGNANQPGEVGANPTHAGGRSGAGSSSGASGAAGSAGASGSPFGSPSMPASNLAASRGSDWGLPDRAVGATGITRPISLACYADRLVLLPENRRHGRPFQLDVEGRLRDEVDELVSQIWQRMESWGTAGSRMYWKPVLQVDVQSGGESRYEELVSLLQDSGIVVKRK